MTQNKTMGKDGDKLNHLLQKCALQYLPSKHLELSDVSAGTKHFLLLHSFYVGTVRSQNQCSTFTKRNACTGCTQLVDISEHEKKA